MPVFSRVLRDTIDLGDQQIDVDAALRFAGLGSTELRVEVQNDGKLRIANAEPEKFARFIDALFRCQLGVRPFEVENDYAVGAEW